MSGDTHGAHGVARDISGDANGFHGHTHGAHGHADGAQGDATRARGLVRDRVIVTRNMPRPRISF